MANHNPYAARQAKRRAHKPGNLTDVCKVLWTAIREAERLLYQSEDPEVTLRCVHALSQACGQYLRVLEVGEFESRLAAIEAELQKGAHR